MITFTIVTKFRNFFLLPNIFYMPKRNSITLFCSTLGSWNSTPYLCPDRMGQSEHFTYMGSDYFIQRIFKLYTSDSVYQSPILFYGCLIIHLGLSHALLIHPTGGILSSFHSVSDYHRQWYCQHCVKVWSKHFLKISFA